jgi:divalent metal cation (Fe/Co/Zn/Cd) transporter
MRIIRNSVNKLLGEKPDQALIQQVKDLIGRISDGEIFPHHFHLHTYGDHRELTFHILLKGTLDIATGHDIANRIEKAIRKEMNIEATIHVEPAPAEKESLK